MKPYSRRLIIVGFVSIAVLAGIAGWLWSAISKPKHQHCIKIAYSLLNNYAAEHDDAFPASESGWGDAILLLEESLDSKHVIRTFTGVDDDGSVLRQARLHGTDVPEHLCSRIYVQGLTLESNPDIAVLFDRHPTKGGDHFRNLPGQPKLREVITVSGGFQTVHDRDWPEFVRTQVEMLRREGFTPEAIEDAYGS